MKKCQSIFHLVVGILGLKVAEHGEKSSIINSSVDNLLIIFKFGENACRMLTQVLSLIFWPIWISISLLDIVGLL